MVTLSVDKILKTSQGAAEFTLPATDGTAGQVWQTDGSGQLSAGNISGISVAATNLSASGTFTSRGIDDNADSNAITIDSNENVIIGDTAVSYAGDKVFIKGNASGVDDFRVLVRNINTTSTANSTLTLSTQGATGGDPRVLFNIDGVLNVLTLGVDNSDSDNFKISRGNALGTNDQVIIDSTGAMTKPLQPAFFAYNSTQRTSVTGNGVQYTILCDTEMYDQGSDYNPANGTFTAPVSGRYFIQGCVSTDGQTTTNTDADFLIATSNKSISYYYSPGYDEGRAVTGQCSAQISAIMDMDANDTANIKVRIYQGSQNLNVQATNTFFSAALIA